jgi:hypothetical protein
VGTAAGWACALFGLWFLFTGLWKPLYGLWAAGAAVLTGAVAAVLASRGLLPHGLRARWAAMLPKTLWQTVLDFGVVTAVLARSMARGRRGPVGRFVRRDTGAVGADPGTRALRAWLTAVVTLSPNAYVVDIDERSGRALVHDLAPRRASEEPL